MKHHSSRVKKNQEWTIPSSQLSEGFALKKYLEIYWLEPDITGGLILAKTKYTILFYMTRRLPFTPKQCCELLLYSDLSVDETAVPRGSRGSLVCSSLVDRMFAVIIYYWFLLSANKVFHLRTQAADVCKISGDLTLQGNTFFPSSLTEQTWESNQIPSPFWSFSGWLVIRQEPFLFTT